MRLAVLMAVSLALAFGPGDAHGEVRGVRGVDFPVTIQLVGRGEPARLFVSAIVTPSPCDAPSARPLYDAMVPMGAVVSLVSPNPCICYRNASGSFRSKDLGAHHNACFPRFAGDTLPMRIVIDVK